MTTIDQILPGQAAGVEIKPRTAATPEGASFQSMLEKAAATLDESQPASVGGVTPATEIGAAAPVAAVGAPDQVQSMAMGQAQNLLADLDSYAQALEQGRSLKEMSGLVQSIENQAGALDQAASELPEGDELAGLLRQVSAVATAEAVKFNRGDFIPA